MLHFRTLPTLLSLITLLTFLLSGCAGPIGPDGKPISATMKKALDARDANDRSLALVHFDQAVIKGEAIPTKYVFDYALNLSQIERYEDAISQFSAYIDAVDRNDARLPQARHERFLAQRKVDAEKELAALSKEMRDKLQTAAQTAAVLGPDLDSSWIDVAAKLEAKVNSFIEPVTGITMLLVKGGCFQMGDLFGEGRPDEAPVHEVCVDDYYLGQHEATQAQWTKIMGYNPSAYDSNDKFPVESINWREAKAFTEYLSGSSGHYRLPTEAEWEYAARSGGKKQKFSGSDQVDDVAWHRDNSNDSPQPVGTKKANELGFYDMSGNMYEWCQDIYSPEYYQTSPKENPTGALEGELRIRRGGSWDSRISYSRTSYRTPRHQDNYRSEYTGFRIALPATIPVPVQSAE